MVRTISRLRRNPNWILLSLAMLLAASVWLLAASGNHVLGANSKSSQGPTDAGLYQALAGSVVRIEAGREEPHEFIPESLDVDVFRRQFMQTDWGGTGFAINEEGHILTSYSNVKGANSIDVILADGRWLEAEVLGIDPYANLAVLSIAGNEHGLEGISMANASQPAIGDTVYAFGFADSYDGTLTKGIVSGRNGSSFALRQQGYSLPASLQSDFLVLPGMTGGPLVNEFGELIGVNLGSGISLFGRESLNNSIPVEVVQTIAPVLADGQSFAYPYLGVSGGKLTVAKAIELQLSSLRSGAFIATVSAESPAAGAGLTPGVVVTEINGEPIRSFAEMATSLLIGFEPEDTVSISVWRQGELQDFEVVLGERHLSVS